MSSEQVKSKAKQARQKPGLPEQGSSRIKVEKECVWTWDVTYEQVLKGTVHSCREKIYMAKAQLEFKLANTVKNDKNGFLSKSKIRTETTLSTLNTVGHLKIGT